MYISRPASSTGKKLLVFITGVFLSQTHALCWADYSVQVGAFSDKTRADRYVTTLEKQDFTAATHKNNSSPSALNHVRVGPYQNKLAAEEVRSQLEARGISGFLVENNKSPHTQIINGYTSQAPQTTTNNKILVAAAGQDQSDDPSSFDDLFMPVPDETEPADGSSSEIENVPGEGWVTEYNTGSRKYNFRGFLNSKYAYTYSSPGHSSMLRNTLELESSGRFNENVSWKVSGRGVYDPVFEMNDFYPDRVRDNRRLEGAIHETYLDVSSGDMDFRLGRQNIIWGEMVGLFFADVVSAKDTRQFVAEDFDLIRIPQWAVRAEHFMGDFHSEAIWIPYMTYNEIGKPGDDFYPLGTGNLKGNPAIRNDDQPAQKLSNGAYGLRLSMLKAGWDISGFFYHSVDAAPHFSRSINNNGQTVLTPEHDKIDQLGTTLAKDFGAVLVKAEAIYTWNRWFNVDDASSSTGVVQQDTLDYVVGLEHTFINGTLLNFQFFQRWYTDHDSDLLFDRFETGISLYASTEFNSKTEGEILMISGLNRTDWMIRPKVTWDLASNWWLAVGVDIFGGDSIGLFGRFDDSDRVYGNVRYSF